MPSTRLTIALNANRNLRSVITIADAAQAYTLISKAAQSKLRVSKKATLRIFVAGTGLELTSAEEVGNFCQTSGSKDALLLISTSEEYIGKVQDGITSLSLAEGSTPATVVNLSVKSYVEPDALRQLTTTATTLPGIIHAVGQPDLHPGNKYPIGAAFVSRGWIHPPLIGGDIGCGMAWYRLSLDSNSVSIEKGKRIAEKLVGLEGPWQSDEARAEWLGTDRRTAFDDSLGTIGAGNHFAEIQVVEKIYREDPAGRLKLDDVVLLVHSGSRGYGGDILKRFNASESIADDSEIATAYLEEHDHACDWAIANRDLIALRLLECLEPQNFRSSSLTPKELRELVQSRKVVDILHNNMEKVKWHDGGDVWIHRKGAAPTKRPCHRSSSEDTDSSYLDILPLPGSRATSTAILRPIPGPHDQDLRNAHSAAHGAGRAMTRTKALQSLSSKYDNNPQRLLVPRMGEGTWVICEDKQLVWEEAPEAYKDINAVAADLEDAGLVEVVGWCYPRVSYKVRA